MTKPNAIEEIMRVALRTQSSKEIGVHPSNLGRAESEYVQECDKRVVRAILAALDAAGLAVVPKKATEQMRRMASADRMLLNEIGWVGVFQRTWAEMCAAFDPATWKPKP